MSVTLHAFFNYNQDGEHINYVDDLDFDYCVSTEIQIDKLLRYAGNISGVISEIPTYDTYDDVEKAKAGLNLVKPDVMVANLRAAINALKSLSNNDNPEICNYTGEYLFDSKSGDFESQRDSVISYAESLLNKAESGRYFVWDRE